LHNSAINCSAVVEQALPPAPVARGRRRANLAARDQLAPFL